MFLPNSWLHNVNSDIYLGIFNAYLINPRLAFLLQGEKEAFCMQKNNHDYQQFSILSGDIASDFIVSMDSTGGLYLDSLCFLRRKSVLLI